MFKFIPREEKYFELFQKMAERIKPSTEILVRLFNDIENAERYSAELTEIEHQCDELTHEVIKRLNKSFITPIDREDIHALITALDTIVDLIDSVAVRVLICGVKQSTPAMKELAKILADAALAAGEAVEKLSSHEENVMETSSEIRGLETKGDQVYRRAMRELFAQGQDPILLIKHKEVYEVLEGAIGACAEAANVLENIALKNT
jgi:predicted phosphate transport protein (TIGR00153 family)